MRKNTASDVLKHVGGVPKNVGRWPARWPEWWPSFAEILASTRRQRGVAAPGGSWPLAWKIARPHVLAVW